MSDIFYYSHKLGLDKINLPDLFLNIQNISLFCISISSAFLVYQTSRNKELEYEYHWNALIQIVGIHAATDFFITKNIDLKIHHVYILGIIFYNYYYNVSFEDKFIFLYSLLKTEISSIFYILKYYLPKNSIIYNINNIIFFALFFKFRLVDFYSEIITNTIGIDYIIQNYSRTNYILNAIIFICIYGLYALNIYWFLIINKILYKSLNLSINKESICHYLCSFIQFINIPVSIFIYSYSPNQKYMFDMIGIIGLSISSYLYHIDIYNRFTKNQITEYLVPDHDNIVLFFNDNIFIQFRSFLTLITSFYYNDNFLFYFFISGTFHSLSLYHVILNIFNLLNNSEHKSNGEFNNINNLLTLMPITVDVVLIFFNMTTNIAKPFLLVNVLLNMLLFIEPYYKLNHVALHFLLIIHNYYLCLSHKIDST